MWWREIKIVHGVLTDDQFNKNSLLEISDPGVTLGSLKMQKKEELRDAGSAVKNKQC